MHRLLRISPCSQLTTILYRNGPRVKLQAMPRAQRLTLPNQISQYCDFQDCKKDAFYIAIGAQWPVLQVLSRMLGGCSVPQLMAAIAPGHSLSRNGSDGHNGIMRWDLFHILEVIVHLLLDFWLLPGTLPRHVSQSVEDAL